MPAAIFGKIMSFISKLIYNFICRYPAYIDWFFTNGMSSLYPNQNNEEILSQAVPAPEGDVGDLGFQSDDIRVTRCVSISFYIFIYHFNLFANIF